jgi:hypothetical protein
VPAKVPLSIIARAVKFVVFLSPSAERQANDAPEREFQLPLACRLPSMGAAAGAASSLASEDANKATWLFGGAPNRSLSFKDRGLIFKPFLKFNEGGEQGLNAYSHFNQFSDRTFDVVLVVFALIGVITWSLIFLIICCGCCCYLCCFLCGCG